jgi:hypothetical protein
LPDAFIKTTGVEFKDGGMQYFAHSDNFALAYAGVPAHTISAGFSFREYHTVSDSADKLDYANMAAVSEGIAVGLRKLASGEAPPTWKEGAGQKIRTAPRK